MKIDVLVAEIGSTTTVVNGFNGIGTPAPSFVGQGHAPTSVLQGDVRVGLKNATLDLASNIGVSEVSYDKMLATSSAAGGLRMTVHGLIYEMTARAGTEAALGAGANIHMTTAGILMDTDVTQMESILPNLILLAGGTDYGERETAAKNAEIIAASNATAPVIYCGNIQNREIVKNIFDKAGRKIYITENVYPRLDELNVEPVRKLIQKAFEERITEAPGMEHVREMVTGKIMPTPGAVMECAKILYEEIGDIVVLDVGGATTDVHSVTDGSEEIALIQISPEPKAKRTVEGDLGVYVNAKTLCELVGHDILAEETGAYVEKVLECYEPIPKTDEQLALTTALTWHASSIALKRHAGRLRFTYGAGGRRTWATGKDLTKTRWLVATGGALTRLPLRNNILERLTALNTDAQLLYPRPGELRVLEDREYIMASLGVLSGEFPKEAMLLLKSSLDFEKNGGS